MIIKNKENISRILETAISLSKITPTKPLNLSSSC